MYTADLQNKITQNHIGQFDFFYLNTAGINYTTISGSNSPITKSVSISAVIHSIWFRHYNAQFHYSLPLFQR